MTQRRTSESLFFHYFLLLLWGRNLPLVDASSKLQHPPVTLTLPFWLVTLKLKPPFILQSAYWNKEVS